MHLQLAILSSVKGLYKIMSGRGFEDITIVVGPPKPKSNIIDNLPFKYFTRKIEVPFTVKQEITHSLEHSITHLLTKRHLDVIYGR